MKKLVCFLLTFSILFNFFGTGIVVYAQNQKQYQITEANIEGEEGTIYYFSYENSEYFVYSEGNQIIAVDMKTMEEVAILTDHDVEEVVNMKSDSKKKSIQTYINEKSNVGARYSALLEMYDEWSREPNEDEYSFKRKLSFTVNEAGSIGVITALLLKYAEATGLLIAVLPAVATWIYENAVQNIEVVVYQRNNLHCEILVKRKASYYELVYNSDGVLLNRIFIRKDTDYNPHWLGTPWDYATYPNACRVLTEKY